MRTRGGPAHSVTSPRITKPHIPKPRKKPAVPYNPLVGSMPTYGQMQGTARQRSAADTAAAIAALPSQQQAQAAANSLAALLAQDQAQTGKLTASAGSAYQQAYQQNQQPANAAIISAGAQPTKQAEGGGFLSAMGAAMGQALGGGVQAAHARGYAEAQRITQMESAAKAKQQALYNQYLDTLRGQAFNTAIARSNIELAGGKLDQQAQQNAAQNTIAEQRLTLQQQAQQDRVAAQNAKAAQTDQQYRHKVITTGLQTAFQWAKAGVKPYSIYRHLQDWLLQQGFSKNEAHRLALSWAKKPAPSTPNQPAPGSDPNFGGKGGL